MFGMILRTQWAWTRATVAGLSLITFCFPALAWRAAASRGRDVLEVMDGFGTVGIFLGFIALLGSFVLAALPWSIDHETRHVYPLSLPVSWRRWVTMRYVAGAVTLILPAIALWAGALATVSLVELPPLLRGYPGALALRFLLACLVAYSATFALQYLAGRRATIVASSILAAVGAVIIALNVLGAGDVAMDIGRWFFETPGPFAIFVEPWALIDV